MCVPSHLGTGGSLGQSTLLLQPLWKMARTSKGAVDARDGMEVDLLRRCIVDRTRRSLLARSIFCWMPWKRRLATKVQFFAPPASISLFTRFVAVERISAEISLAATATVSSTTENVFPFTGYESVGRAERTSSVGGRGFTVTPSMWSGKPQYLPPVVA